MWTLAYRECGRRQVRYKACVWCERPTLKSRPKAAKPIRKRVTLAAKRIAAKKTGTVDEFQREEILRFHSGLCGYCGERPWTHWDHKIPIAKGGRDEAGNLVPACEPCNMRKGTSTKWEPKRRHPFMVRENRLGELSDESLARQLAAFLDYEARSGGLPFEQWMATKDFVETDRRKLTAALRTHRGE